MISIAEGKTKIIIEDPRNRKEVRIKSKSDITAGDGMSRHSLSGKNVLATETTCNCFSLLNQRGVPTHFIRQVSADTFVAKRVRMIPIEMVVRRIAFGSYLKRNTYVKEGAVFKILPVEFFLKDDSHHDPMMIWNEQKQIFDFYDPKKPIENGFMDDLELPFEKIVYLPR
jgi:phosphoribosylaminoimidazole-succinocarboxamide synthase